MKAGRSPRLNFPEQRYARHTLLLLASRILHNKVRRDNALFLIVGPSGCGKTRLLRGFQKKILSCNLAHSKTVQMGGARDMVSLWREQEIRNREGANVLRKQIIDLDLLILEDVQHLKKEESSYLTRLIDERAAHRKATIFSSTLFTQKLTHIEPAFLNRLNSALLIEMPPLGQESKLLYLTSRLSALGMNLEPRMIEWLSQKAEGSLRKMQSLCNRIAHDFKQHQRQQSLEDLGRVVQSLRPASKIISMENIALKVGKMFHITPKSIITKKRDKETLLPRQVGMYIARRMTGMTLLEIGAFFGGRNHTTVSHAVRKVEKALLKDHALSGTIRQLENDLS